MKIISIKDSAFFTKYSLDEQLIILVIVSLFIPFHFAAVPVVLISVFALFNKKRRRNLINISDSRYAVSVIPISIIACFIFRNWLGLATTLLLFFVIVFALYVRSFMTYRFFTDMLNIIIGLSIIPAVIGALQKLYFLHVLKPNDILPFDGRVYSVFSNPNYYAYIIVLFITTIIYRIICIDNEKNPRRKFFYYTVLALNIVALVLTNCRSSLIALILAIFILTVTQKKQWAAIFLFVVYFAYLALIEIFPDIFPRMDFLYLDSSFNARAKIWAAAVNGIKESPIIGQGTLGYKILFSRHPEIPNKHHAHNLLIDMVLNFGLLGTGLLTMYFIKSLNSLRKYFKIPEGKNLFMFMLSVLAVTITHGLTDVTILGIQTGILFVLFISGFGIEVNNQERK